MTRRRIPRWSDLQPLIRPASGRRPPGDRRLASAATVWDLRAIARRRTPRAVFDYVDGAAESESSLDRARDAFGRVEFRPRVLRDVSSVDTSTTILGSASTLPLALAPTGFTRLMHHEGEIAVARSAGRTGIPYALSTLGTTSPEDLATAVPDTIRWFQLYLWRDRAASRDLLARVAAAGYPALMLTVDTPAAGTRLRDVRNGLTIPPALTFRTLLDIAGHPGWWFNLLTTEPLRFASLRSSGGTVAELVNRTFDPAVTLADLDWLRGAWGGKLVVKGIQSVEDAVSVVDHGADAVVVSNHGGRQLDRAPVPLELLPEVVGSVDGRAEVYLDGGILTGSDIVAAVAFGATACLVGRAYLYGLMAGGERGVDRALALLAAEVTRTMRLLGAPTLADLTPARVHLRTCASR